MRFGSLADGYCLERRLMTNTYRLVVGVRELVSGETDGVQTYHSNEPLV